MIKPVHKTARRRLFEAAIEVFAEHGFRRATIREICERAGANNAAVNYYFGGKKHLYDEVMRTGLEILREGIKVEIGQIPHAAPRDRLELFIYSLMHHIQNRHLSSICVALISHEIVEQSKTLDTVVGELIMPVCMEMEPIAYEFLGTAATEHRVRLFSASVIVNCLSYFHCQPLLVRLFPDHSGKEDFKTLASQIIEFALGNVKLKAEALKGNS